MAEISGALFSMASLLVIAVVGYACAKLDYLDEHTKGKITKLLVNVTLPCMIVASAGEVEAGMEGGQVVIALVMGLVQFCLLMAFGIAYGRITRAAADQRPAYIMTSICVNNGFIGIPVVSAIYGPEAAIFGSIFVMGMSVLFYSVGLGYIAGEGRVSGKALLMDMLRQAVNPTSVAAVLALVLVFSGVRLPNLVQSSLDLLGGVTAPLAMMVVGQIVSTIRPAQLKGQWRLYLQTVLRQLVLPIITFVIMLPLGLPIQLAGMFVCMMAMPTGSMASIFAEQCGRDGTVPALGTVFSSITSFAFIPLLVALMALL